MNRIEYVPEGHEALWNRAQRAGLTRRRFLALLAAGGATAVLASCTPQVVRTPVPSPTPSPTTTPATTRPINKPVPEQFFIPLGINQEMRFK